MANEKKKVIIHRLSWLFIVVFIMIIPTIINSSKPELKVIDYEGYINDYYSILDETSVTIYIKFNRKVNSGYATIIYYDDANNPLETKKSFFDAYGEKTAKSYEYISGKVSSFELKSYNFDTAFTGTWIYFLLFPAIIMLIGSLLLRYREYDYNGKKISVYAGWSHHTLRIDGELCDEHITIMSYTPLKLSTTLDDNIKIEATISLSNRISLKINDKLAS